MKQQAQPLSDITILNDKPSYDDAIAAVETLLRYASDDPDREGLKETPKRVVKSYEEFFSGYTKNPDEILAKTFEEVEEFTMRWSL